MNRVLLKSICTEFLRIIKRTYIDASERRHNTNVEYDRYTGYPQRDPDFLEEFSFTISDFIFQFNHCTKDYQLTNEDYVFVYSECIKTLKFYIFIVDSFVYKDYNEYGQFYATENEKEDLENGLNDCIEYCEEEIIKLSQQMETKPKQEEVPAENKTNKIKWNSSPLHFGFIINELINKGYFINDTLPVSNAEINYSEIAMMFNSIIDFDTTDAYLKKSFNPNEEKLSETVKNKFTIPDCKDIKPKNSKPPKTLTNKKKY